MKKTVFSSAVLIGMLFFIACDKKTEKILDPRCEMTPHGGPCNAYIIKYYWDPVEQKCTLFGWGGCGGSVPFQSLQECEECDCAK